MHLYAWYHDCDNVHVNQDAYPRKYIEFGNTLLGLGHGDKEKKETLTGLMPIEAKEAWGRTKYHEYHVAHLHSEQMTQEKNGLIIRRMSSPVAQDTWTVDMGLLGSERKIQTFVYDRNKGLEHIIQTRVEGD
jgi:glycogen debranching enzyme